MTRFAWTVPLVAWIFVAWAVGEDDKPAGGDDKPVVVELWPGKVPDEAGNIGPEKVSCRRSWTASRSRLRSRPRW